MKRIFAFLLVCLMLLALVACGGEDTSKAESNETVSTDTSSDVSDAEIVYSAVIPEGFDYFKEEYIVLTTATNLDNVKTPEFGYNSDELESSVLNDAIANRNLKVEQLTGVKIVEDIVVDGNRMQSGEMVKHVQTQVNGGTADFDLVSPSIYATAAIAKQGLFYDLNTVDNMQLTSEWWDTFLAEEAAIDGKLFFITGDIGKGSRGSLTAVYFNKETVRELDLGDPYQLVRDKQWTLDTVLTWSKKISQDLDNDGVINYKDKFGMGGQNDNVWAFFYGSGETISSKNENGRPIITIKNDRSTAVVDKIAEIVTNKDYFINANDFFGAEGTESPATLLSKAFSEGRSLFFCENLNNVEDLRNMEFDFGILPTPLYDENQERYYSLLNCWVGNAFGIATSLTPDEADLSAVVFNALSAEGKNLVMPAYIETTLKGQRFRDDESREMLDIIFENIGCDIGHIYDFGSMGSQVLHQIPKGGNFVSLVDSYMNSANAAIDSLMDAFAAIE